eukprot:6222070-Amphidinium_carterae.2
MKSPLQEGQDLVVQLSCPGVTHRAREISYQVSVLGQEAASQDVYGNMSSRAVVWAVLNEGAESNQTLLKGVGVSLEEGIYVAGDAHRDGPVRRPILPDRLATECEPLDVCGTRATYRTCRSPDVEFAGVEAKTTWTKGRLKVGISTINVRVGTFDDPIVNILIIPAFNSFATLQCSESLQGYFKASAEPECGQYVSLRDPKECGANLSAI